jgi:transcription elongation factor Elf1
MMRLEKEISLSCGNCGFDFAIEAEEADEKIGKDFEIRIGGGKDIKYMFHRWNLEKLPEKGDRDKEEIESGGVEEGQRGMYPVLNCPFDGRPMSFHEKNFTRTNYHCGGCGRNFYPHFVEEDISA